VSSVRTDPEAATIAVLPSTRNASSTYSEALDVTPAAAGHGSVLANTPLRFAGEGK
jgi:hypothetical protein